MTNSLKQELNKLQRIQYIAPVASLILIWVTIMVLKQTNSFEAALGISFIIDFVLIAFHLLIIGKKEALKIYLKELEGDDNHAILFWGNIYYSLKYVNLKELYSKNISHSSTQHVYNDLETLKR